MLSRSLVEGLSSYTIGEKLRGLRLQKKLGLVELGRHSGLSPAMLSKIERGRVFPTLPTLLRIAQVFSLGLDYFFSERANRPVVAVVRASDRLRFPDRLGRAAPAYHFENLDFPVTEPRLHAYHAEFHPQAGKVRAAHDHPGIELLYVMTGRLGITMGEKETILSAGDSIYFDSTVPHAYRRLGSKACRALVVTAP